MKLRMVAMLAMALCLASVVPALAVTAYDNGPINGNVDAWTINFGFAVSDTFTLGSATEITGLSFGVWLFPGDSNPSVEVSITSEEFGGTTYFDQTLNFSQGLCFTNGFGFDVCQDTASWSGTDLQAGTYWINLQNASVSSGDPVYWDENSGPSQASENSVGTIPSEAFTILAGEIHSTTTGTGTTPEPGSIFLFGSGVLGLAEWLRRRFV